MGGDSAPQMVMQGLEKFLAEHPTLSIKLYGDQTKIEPHLTPSLAQNVAGIVHTPEYITPDMTPMACLRLRQSSMRLALEAVAKAEVDGMISAGHTGGYLLLSRSVLKPLPGVRRPVIASLLPSKKGATVMLDLGGNLEADAEDYHQFALMGSHFAQKVLHLDKPKVGIINVGAELTKGSALLRDASALCQGDDTLNFQGFIEGHDVTLGTVDVAVTDGFTGNVALKTGEGLMEFLTHKMKDVAHQSWRHTLMALAARPFLSAWKQYCDPKKYNGALWLGVEGVAVKSHGGADAQAFYHALVTTLAMIKAKIHTSFSLGAPYV